MAKEGAKKLVFAGLILVIALSVVFVWQNDAPKYVVLTGLQVYEPAVLGITNVSPGFVHQAATVQLNVTGTGFNSSAVLFFSNPDISVLSLVVVNSTLVEVNVSVAINVSPGFYDVTINQITDESTLPAALEVLEGPFDVSTLTNVTPDDGYINTSETLNLTYNITTASGVDKSSVNVIGGWINITNLNTSNWTVLNMTSAIDPEGTFTVQFEEHTFIEEGYYLGEMYLDLEVDGEYVEREYYVYFGVGDIIIFSFCGDFIIEPFFGEECDPAGAACGICTDNGQPCVPGGDTGLCADPFDPDVCVPTGDVCDPVCKCQPLCTEPEFVSFDCTENAQFECPLSVPPLTLCSFGNAVLCCGGIDAFSNPFTPSYNFGPCSPFDVFSGGCETASLNVEGCDETCVKVTVCGDDIVEGAEQCDPPGSDCTAPFSGTCEIDCQCPGGVIADSVGISAGQPEPEIDPNLVVVLPIGKKCCTALPTPSPTPPPLVGGGGGGGGGRPCYFEVIDISSDGKSTTIHFASKPNCPLTVSLGGRTFNVIKQDITVTVPFYPGPNVPVFVNGRKIGETPEVVPKVEIPAPVPMPAAPPFVTPPKKACPEAACVPLPYGMGVRDDVLSVAFGVDVVPCSQIDVTVLDLLALVGDASDKARYELVKRCCPCPVIEYPAAPCPASRCEKTLSGELGVRDSLLSALHGVAVVPCSVIDIYALDLLALTGDASDKARYQAVNACCPKPCP
ncbi:MAG: hypothetical protein QW165_00930 [Candidatus Woesearchaeota archaeon]